MDDVKFVTVWAVLLGGDDKSSGNPAEWYSTEPIAKIAAKNRGWYGGDATIARYHAIQVNGSTYILQYRLPVDLDQEQAKQVERVKQESLSKLTDEERKALGIL
jgi:hypothetical protein